MSATDRCAAVSFVSFVLLEWWFSEQKDYIWQIRLFWVCISAFAIWLERGQEGDIKEAQQKPLEVKPTTELNISTIAQSFEQSPSKATAEIVVELPPPEPTTSPSEESGTRSDFSQSETTTKKAKSKSIFRKSFTGLKPFKKILSKRASKGDSSRDNSREVSNQSPLSLDHSVESPAIMERKVESASPVVVGSSPLGSSPVVSSPSPSSIRSSQGFGFGPEPEKPDVVYVRTETWGYPGHLNQDETTALEKLRSKNLSCLESRMNPPAFVINDETLLRFLRARKFDFEKSVKMLVHHLTWRDKFAPSQLTPNDISAVLGSGLARFGPYSKSGLPVVIVKVEYFEPSIFEDMDTFTKYVAFFFERCVRRLPDGADKGILFFDMKGWSLFKHATPHALRLTGELLHVIQAHNPERLEKCILFNTPFVFSGTWSLIKSWLDPVVAKKVVFVSDTKLVRELFNENDLPKEYGGKRELPYPIEGFAELHPLKSE